MSDEFTVVFEIFSLECEHLKLAPLESEFRQSLRFQLRDDLSVKLFRFNRSLPRSLVTNFVSEFALAGVNGRGAHHTKFSTDCSANDLRSLSGHGSVGYRV